MNLRRILFTFILLAAVTTACQPSPLDKSDQNDPWSYVHLRLIDTPDDLPPDQDTIAMYARPTHTGLQVRLDFMDLTNPPPSDLYIALDHKNGGTDVLPTGVQIPLDWDLLVQVSTDGTLSVVDSDLIHQPNITSEITIDKDQDTLVISIQGDELTQIEGEDQLHLTTASPGQGETIDELGPVALNADPPEPVHLLLAFWDVMPGFTPAMALRAWDGAHIGPYGARHGLNHLLAAAARYSVPLALLDLKAPYALSALDILDSWAYLQALIDEGLLTLPDVLPNPRFGALPDWALARAAGDSRQMAAAFGLPESETLYAPGQVPESWSTLNDGYSLIFYNPTDEESTSHGDTNPRVLFQSADGLVITLPPDLAPEQASRSGPTLAMRITLLAGANTNDLQTPVILGGPLHATTWGDPQALERTFAWLTDHPWIHILLPSDFAALASDNLPFLDQSSHPDTPRDDTLSPAFESAYADLLSILRNAPQNRITEVAWQAFQALLAPLPGEPDNLISLRAAYLNQIGSMIAASEWSRAPVPIADCSLDLDWDNQSECILANEVIFTIWEIDGGRMLYAFWRRADGIHQIVGPRSQLVSGLSDPSSWLSFDTALRDRADIAGAFSDQDASGITRFASYLVETGYNQLIWSNPDGSIDKTITLTPSGILAEYNSLDRITVELPLLINPDVRFSPNWVEGYRIGESEDQFSWEWAVSHNVIVSSTGDLRWRTFLDSLVWMRLPEDPDQDYPSGHMLPFPLAEITIAGQGAFSIVIELR